MPTRTRSMLSCILVLSIAVGFAGCSSRPTMEELEQEAARTGDWSEVEKRQRMNRRMRMVESVEECPNGESLLCRQKGEREHCECISSQLIRSR